MNRLFLKYPYPTAAIILLIFAWIVIQRLVRGVDAVIPLAIAALIVWPLGMFAFIWVWPRITVAGFKRAILSQGLGAGPIPINSLFAVRDRPSSFASRGSVMATGTDDLVYIGGWLDTRDGPLVLHVPEMHGRYYSLQFTDPESGANVAYVGKRTTGTGAGEYLLCKRTWTGAVPRGMTRISLPHRSALVIGRVFAADEGDRSVAYELAKLIMVRPLDQSLT